MTPESHIDRLTEALNAAAQPGELAAQSAMISQMAGLASPTTGVAMIIKTILGHKVAAVAGALVLGTTTAAAASGNVPFLAEDPADEIAEIVLEAPEVTTTTVMETTTTTEESAEDIDLNEVQPPVNEDGEPYGDVACDEAKNHGEYVSGVARDKSIEGNRGQIVSQAAKTSCGKKDDQDDAESDDDKADKNKSDDHDESDESDHDESDEKSNNGVGSDKSKAKKAKKNG